MISHRYYKVLFNGFLPHGKAIFVKLPLALFTYLKAKVVQVSRLMYLVLLFIFKSPVYIKEYIVVKLIWSRGRLGRRLAPAVVFTASFVVFIFGKVLSSSTLVSAQEINPDYVSHVSDIIPQKYVATTLVPEDRKRTEPFAYTVEGGDTVSGIGSKFKISKDALLYVNGLTDSSILKVGQELTIPPVSGLIHTVEDGDTLTSIANKYDVAPQAIADFNYLLDIASLTLGTELVIPGASVPEVVPVFVAQPSGNSSFGATQQAVPNNAFCVWPTTTRIITQYYSWYHNGLDVATPYGGGMPPLFSCTSGTVVRAGWDPFGLGLHVRIDHGNGYQTIYGHMSRIDVSYGERVGRGERIGLMGSTGNSTGAHVHFIVNYNGVSQNPSNFTQ